MANTFRSTIILVVMFLLVIDLSESFLSGGHGKRGAHQIFKKVSWTVYDHTQPTHDVKTTLYERCYNVKTIKRRPHNVVLTSCADWVGILREMRNEELREENCEK